MDLHPILVHFPVALLTVYAALECIRLKKVLEKPYWFYIKATLAIFGELGALAAYATGHGVRGSTLVHMHSMFATITVWLFAILSLSYLNEWLKREGRWHIKFALPGFVIIILAILGLASVTITGGLGGAIVYGTHFDPFMAPIFKLLGVY